MEVKNLKELIAASLGNGKKLISYQSSNLLSSGENYGSILLRIQAKYFDENSDEREIDWVAKIAPPIPFLWEFFNTPVTFKKEVGVYKVIQPTLNEFGKEKGIDNLIDIFAKYNGSRYSLDANSEEVDRNAVLLMENLKITGFESKDRFAGFDFDCTELILRDLATLHASVIAFKRAKPKEFQAKILPYLSRDFYFDAGEEQLRQFIETLKGVGIKANPGCAEYLPKVEKIFMDIVKAYRAPLNPRETWATFVHGDLWVNNVLLKFENGKPVKHKMVDFQIIEYNSAANDVLFFLYSSVDLALLEDRVDEFLKMYHEYFVETLKKLDCDIAEYTYESFLEECGKVVLELQLAHLTFMHLPIFTMKGEAKEITEFGSWTTSDIEANMKKMHPICGKRFQFIIMNFAKRGWI
ncbi:putative vesicle docking protein [Trypoxylus dichotomus]